MRYFDEDRRLYFEKYDDHVEVVEGEHEIDVAIIPSEFEGLPVTSIFKKAFLGCKSLREIAIPDSVVSVGDFAFAMCDRLKRVTFPRKDMKLGQSLFKNDFELEKLYVGVSDDGEKCTYEQLAALLAAAPVTMEAEYLLDIKQVGSADWVEMWDRKLKDFLSRKDDEGYHLYVLCGEEDLHFDYDQYIDYIREKKSGLCLLRLLNDVLLSDNDKTLYTEYLKSNEDAAFNYLYKNHGEDEEYFEICVELSVITKDNRENVLAILGDRFPQTKAYLINAFEEAAGDDMDFFANLEL